MQPNTKEWIQYSSAILMIVSGIILAFLSFFFNNYDIASGVLWYIAQALVYAGGIFGVSLYFKTKMGDFESKANQTKEDVINQIVGLFQEKIDSKNQTTNKEDNETTTKEDSQKD